MSTIYDVARLAGVSPKTVSRVLNADGPVGEKTREAVEKAMRELGYVRSNAARMMRAQKSGIIGLITGALSTKNQPSTQQGLPDLYIVQGIQRALDSSGMTVMIADTAGRMDRVPHLIDTFLSHRVEGLIYVAEYHQEVRLPALPDDTPLVLANCFDSRGTHAVLPDDRRLQADLVRRLIAAGHERIAFLAGPRSLEHLVDVVLHFEGDKHSTLRMVRGVKNRFGAADEVGCFELSEQGINEISDPSGLFLHHREEAQTHRDRHRFGCGVHLCRRPNRHGPRAGGSDWLADQAHRP